MTTANKVTLVRLAMVPVFVGLLLAYKSGGSDVYRWLALVLFAATIFSDGLDGYIASHYNQRSELGAILDPIADKLLLVLGLVVLSQDYRPYLHPVPTWLIGVVFTRDVVLLMGLTIIYYSCGKITVVPHFIGKVSTVLQMATVVATLIKLPAGPVYVVALGAALTTGISGLIYVSEGVRQLNASPPRDRRASKEQLSTSSDIPRVPLKKQ